MLRWLWCSVWSARFADFAPPRLFKYPAIFDTNNIPSNCNFCEITHVPNGGAFDEEFLHNQPQCAGIKETVDKYTQKANVCRKPFEAKIFGLETYDPAKTAQCTDYFGRIDLIGDDVANVNCWKKECNTELADWAKCVNKFILKEKYDLSCWCVTNFPADTIPAPGAAQTLVK